MTKEEAEILSLLMTLAECLNTDIIKDDTMEIRFIEDIVLQ